MQMCGLEELLRSALESLYSNTTRCVHLDALLPLLLHLTKLPHIVTTNDIVTKPHMQSF